MSLFLRPRPEGLGQLSREPRGVFLDGPGAFVRGSYCRPRVGPYRVLYEVEGDLITIVRTDRV